ncbi:isoprenoid synthase domain-containing protein [Xylariaceae sp. FL0804]|nr:isoprenoid synthase domain-containing protein [Xylariaceae sp. FL0804]
MTAPDSSASLLQRLRGALSRALVMGKRHPESPAKATASPEALLCQLRGAQLKVPNMRPLYAGWTSVLSPHYQTVVDFTEQICEKLIPEEAAREKARACDFGFTSAGWFPGSDLEKLKFMACYCCWVFCWDDFSDREGVSLEEGNQHRAEAARYIRYHLGLAPEGTPEPEASTIQLEVFADVGKHVREHCDKDTAQAFCTQVEHILACSGKEQETSKALPTKKQYWDIRYGTSTVYSYCAIAPHMCGVQLPQELFNSPEMKAVWLEMNINIIIFNDIISLKKELADDAVLSLIPVIMAEDGVGLSEATSAVYEQLVANCKAFDQAKERLREKAKGYGEAVRRDTDKLIECYEAFLTGVMNWSYTNARYRVAQDIQEDGSLVVIL